MAAPLRTPRYLVRIESDGYMKHTGEDLMPTEVCPLRAYYSDGSVEDHEALVTYGEREREQIIERAMARKATEEDMRHMRRIVDRRNRAVERVRGAIQRAAAKALRA
jgi:hypothetical protein